MIAFVMPVGLRPPVSASATIVSSAAREAVERAFSLMTFPQYAAETKRGGPSLGRPAWLDHIQPFSL
jgi:hypothetical protein